MIKNLTNITNKNNIFLNCFFNCFSMIILYFLMYLRKLRKRLKEIPIILIKSNKMQINYSWAQYLNVRAIWLKPVDECNIHCLCHGFIVQ